MRSGSDNVSALADLLRETGATPRVNPERVVRSTLYDLDYHVAVVACVFFTNGENSLDGSRMLLAHWPKLLQFVAVRPHLLASFQRWARARRRPDLETWQKMPRGYLGDRTHDRTIELLVAARVLRREADRLVAGDRFSALATMYNDIVARNLLQAERHTLQELAKTAVNRTLLRGE